MGEELEVMVVVGASFSGRGEVEDIFKFSITDGTIEGIDHVVLRRGG